MPYSAAKLEPALIVKVYDRPDMRCVSCCEAAGTVSVSALNESSGSNGWFSASKAAFKIVDRAVFPWRE